MKSIMQQTAEHIELEKKRHNPDEDGRPNLVDTTCPVCGKNFIPAPYHAYKNKKGTLVCSYRCQLNS